MARAVARVLPLVSWPLPVPPSPAIVSALVCRPAQVLATSSTLSTPCHFQIFTFGTQRRSFHLPSSYSRYSGPFGGIFAALRGFRKVRRRQAVRKQAPEEKKLELRVKISIDQGMPDDHEVVNIVEMLKLNAPMALKIAFDCLKEFECRAQGSSTVDIGKYEKIELCILLCNNEMIKKLNKEWQRDDFFTDVLFRIQDVQGLEISTVTFFFFRKLINLPLRFIFDRVLSRVQLMLGDIVISAEGAARQAEEWGHSLLDEIRILMIRGVLHLLGFNHETSNEAGTEMKKLEELILGTLGWKVRGLPKSAYDVAACYVKSENGDGRISNSKKKSWNLRFYRPKFSYIFCDMDGTLLNSQSQVTITTAKALREAVSRGIKVVIATGKTRPAVISALKLVDLAGKGGIASEMSPGIFLQGMLVYGRQGMEIHRRNLDQSICREALLYSLEHEVPVIAFCQDRCLTLFDHPLVDSLHTIYHEPKAEIMPSVEHLLAAADIQKLIFLDMAEGVSSVLRPHWEEMIDGRAGVLQAQPDMLEIIPADASKGDGVKVLLDHLGISAKEIMAIGDGENDVEMLQLASLGIALGNGSEKAKAAADVIGATNDEDGVAMAIYQYAF